VVGDDFYKSLTVLSKSLHKPESHMHEAALWLAFQGSIAVVGVAKATLERCYLRLGHYPVRLEALVPDFHDGDSH
jgi:hypothetical protein